MSKKKYNKKTDNIIPFANKNFQVIVDFYLFQCPTKGKSKRGKDFNELGWKGSASFSKLKKEMLAASCGNLYKNYYPSSKAELQKYLSAIESVVPCDEYCVFLKNDEKQVMQSLFSAIRNALAHGDFAIRRYKDQSGDWQRIWFFRNFDEYLKAQIVLNEQTLLSWIKIVKGKS